MESLEAGEGEKQGTEISVPWKEMQVLRLRLLRAVFLIGDTLGEEKITKSALWRIVSI